MISPLSTFERLRQNERKSRLRQLREQWADQLRQALVGDDVPLAALPLRALTRMTVSSHYPLDDTPPLDLFDPEDAREAIATAEAGLRWVERLDQPGGEGTT